MRLLDASDLPRTCGDAWQYGLRDEVVRGQSAARRTLTGIALWRGMPEMGSKSRSVVTGRFVCAVLSWRSAASLAQKGRLSTSSLRI